MKNNLKTLLVVCYAILTTSYLSAQTTVPPGFVYTDGDKFMLDERPFYFSGANVYDFFTYGSSSGDIETQFMDKDRIDAHMRTLYVSGVRVVRLWGFSHEDWHGFEPQKGVYSEAQFSLFDYVVKSAEANGIKLIVALENYWNDYGGIKDRLKWEGIEVEGAGTHDQGQFFTNASAIQGYKDYVKYFITRKNHYDGVEYRNDPTILAWELMNEPRYQGFGDDLSSNTLRAWVDDMGEFIKSIDSNHLLGTGLEAHGAKYGFGGDEGNDFIKIHESPYIDFTSAHPYIRESWSNFTLEQTMELMATWANESHNIIKKPLYVGEFNVEIQERYEWWEEIYGYIEKEKIGASAFWWFPDSETPRDKFAVFEGDVEVGIYKEHAHRMEAMSGGEAIYLSLLSPKSGDKFVSGSSVHVEANLTNENNTVVKVEFYSNGELVGEDTTAPYEFDLTGLSDGQYKITSVATAIDGKTKESTPRNIQIGGDGILSLEYKDASANVVSNIIKPHFRIFNNSSQDVAYSDLSIRYWFETEEDLALSFFTDYAMIGSSNVNGKIVNVEGNSYYMEVTFDSAAGTLGSSDGSGRIETKIANSAWSDTDQSNDYSYDGTKKEFAAWDRVALYLNGNLISGTEPNGAETPKAVITTNIISGDAPLLVSFDASGSTDPNGDILTYSWDFGSGNTALGVTADYEFTTIGDQTVKLTVDDGNGNSSSTSIIITVTDPNQPPVADFIADKITGTAPLQVNFDASGSSDPKGNTLTYSWDFGDATTGTGETTTHTFDTIGEYIVILTVDNGQGGTATKTLTIEVVDQLPASDIVLTYKDGGNGSATDNTINPHIQLVNNGDNPVDYKDITIRYWFTSEDSNDLNFWCDWAQVGTDNVSGTFGQSAGNNYLDITFNQSAGILASKTNSGPIQARFAKTNWSNFNEADDYSYDDTKTDYTNHDKIAVYLNSTLVWGVEPSTSGISPIQIKAFPNPVFDELTVNTTTSFKNANIKIIDLAGNIFYEEIIQKNTDIKNLDFSQLRSGIYFIQIEQGGKTTVKQIVK
ncbi:PKD domain-containing protein [Aquimarina algicola]|uniref:PKD domain-containing protein n=1 Tax=Aquimarina algicola TaxID=2589995 RepID=A0A504JMX4_9FLAO|nr:PKD domain-containing protein [Aquimarina algicola]TPN87770.1 PKD domain-containing protein [Aquimarina algicola]